MLDLIIKKYSILTTQRFALWTRLFKAWLTGQFNDVKAVVASVDLTSVTTAIGQAKEEIIAAVEGIDPYVALTSSELDDITSDEDLNTSTNE